MGFWYYQTSSVQESFYEVYMGNPGENMKFVNIFNEDMRSKARFAGTTAGISQSETFFKVPDFPWRQLGEFDINEHNGVHTRIGEYVWYLGFWRKEVVSSHFDVVLGRCRTRGECELFWPFCLKTTSVLALRQVHNGRSEVIIENCFAFSILSSVFSLLLWCVAKAQEVLF